MEAQHQKKVAGTILPDRQKKGVVIGIQFQGRLVHYDPEIMTDVKGQYYRRFPYARAMGGEFMIIKLNFIKMTDHTLGLGKRILWTDDL